MYVVNYLQDEQRRCRKLCQDVESSKCGTPKLPDHTHKDEADEYEAGVEIFRTT
jgi:hypothetical protein